MAIKFANNRSRKLVHPSNSKWKRNYIIFGMIFVPLCFFIIVENIDIFYTIILSQDKNNSTTIKYNMAVTNNNATAEDTPTSVPSDENIPLTELENKTLIRLYEVYATRLELEKEKERKCASVNNTKTIRKKLHTRGHTVYSGLSPHDEMELEKSVLIRIKKVCGCTDHFPRLVKFDNTSMTSTIVGISMYPLRQPPEGFHREEAVQQVDTIIQCLNKSHVRHLDLMQANDSYCKNMAIQKSSNNTQYTVALFDFDMSSMDDIFLHPKLQQLSDSIASSFNDYLSMQHDHMMKKCLGFQ